MPLALPLFVYGTLRDADVVSVVLGRTLDVCALERATALGHLTVYYPGQTYPALLAKPDSSAEGLLFRHLSARDIALLDTFEGDEYRRGSILVQIEGEALGALCYLPTRPIAADARVWTLEEWQRQHKAEMLATLRTTS
jgi:gamma-glutamylcyclotransferase (GGCT)/AIG2-like uncharacterized protein YtfP